MSMQDLNISPLINGRVNRYIHKLCWWIGTGTSTACNAIFVRTSWAAFTWRGLIINVWFIYACFIFSGTFVCNVWDYVVTWTQVNSWLLAVRPVGLKSSSTKAKIKQFHISCRKFECQVFSSLMFMCFVFEHFMRNTNTSLILRIWR